MSRAWRWNLVGHLMCLPFSLVYLAFVVVVYRASSFQWRDGVLTCIGGSFERSVTPKGPHETVTRIWGRPGAQTIGAVQCYADEHQRSRADLRVHENCHVVQCMLGGPLYVVAYVVSFLWFYAWNRRAGWHAAYERIPFEAQAYARQDAWRKMRPVEQVRVWGAR